MALIFYNERPIRPRAYVLLWGRLEATILRQFCFEDLVVDLGDHEAVYTIASIRGVEHAMWLRASEKPSSKERFIGDQNGTLQYTLGGSVVNITLARDSLRQHSALATWAKCNYLNLMFIPRFCKKITNSAPSSPEKARLKYSNGSLTSIFFPLLQIGTLPWRGRLRFLVSFVFIFSPFLYASFSKVHNHLPKVNDMVRMQANVISVIEIFEGELHTPLSAATSSSQDNMKSIINNEKKKYRWQDATPADSTSDLRVTLRFYLHTPPYTNPVVICRSIYS